MAISYHTKNKNLCPIRSADFKVKFQVETYIEDFMNYLSGSLILGVGLVVGMILPDYIRQPFCGRMVISQKGEKKDYSLDITQAIGKTNIVDVAIIGSGPAGLSSALYTSRFARKTLVIGGNNQGGQLMLTSHVENWPGIEKIMGPDLMGKLRTQAAHFGPLFLADSVERVDFGVWPFVIATENGSVIHALSAIIATGASPKKLGIPGEQDYWGRGVTTCAICDAPFYEEQEVIVVGGGDSAIEEAIQLASYVKKVTILVRSNKMRATPAMQKRIVGYPNIEIRYNTMIEKILGDTIHVTGVDIVDTVTKQKGHMSITGVFLAIGHEPNSKLFSPFIDVDDAGYIELLDRSQQTSLPGIFAAGDVEDHVYRQGGVAAGNGIKAAIDADRFLTAIGLDKQVEEKLASNYFKVEKKELKELPKITSLQEYENIVMDEKLPVILDFYTDTCPSCLQMLPVLASVAKEYEGHARFYKVDAEIAEDLVDKFSVFRVPCLIIIKDGSLVARYNEAMGKKELVELVEKIL